MCNQAAGLSRCLTKVQDSVDKAKSKAAERTQQVVEELEYLVTFNQSISQAMQHTMQDLSEGVFISMANLTLARRDSYQVFLHCGVKQDTLTTLRTAPVHLPSLFPDNLLIKAEDEISRSEERHSSGSSHMKPGRFHPYASSSGRSTSYRTGSPLHRPGSKLEDRKVVVKPQTSPRSRPRVQRRINDNYCVLSVAGVKDSVHVSGKKEALNPSPVTSKSKTVFLHVNSCVANVHSVTGLPQKKGVNPNYCHSYTEIKYVKDVSCVGHLSSANIVTNVPTVAINPPVGARLHQSWEKWEALGSSSKVVTALREGYTLPVQFRPNLTRSPTVISHYVNPQRQSHLLEALYIFGILFLVPKPNNRWRPILDLSTLNTFLNTELFKMETPETIRTSLQVGEWVTSMDFKDAYFHMPIHSQSRKYMRFHIQGQSYQFIPLPFGLSTAPMEFTVVAKEVILMALQRGIRIHHYLDDWFV